MRVGFNARLLYSPELRGWNRYTINLLSELASLGVELLLYSDRSLHESHRARLPEKSYQVRVAPPMRYVLWEQRWLPEQFIKDAIDVFHCPINFGLPWISACPRILTLHDAIDQIYYRPTSWRQKLNPRALQVRAHHWIARTRAENVITVSERSKRDLVRHLNIPAEKIHVVYEAADKIFQRPIFKDEGNRIRRKYGLEKPYVFYVGGYEGRKNVKFLLKACAIATLKDVELVLAGDGRDQKVELLELASTLGVSGQIRLLGYVEDTDLPPLYRESLCFVYPSRYEGFGLQLCEAMASGTPIFAASSSCLPEILGDGGQTFSLDSIEELVSYLRRIALEPEYREVLSQKSRRRSSEFSWSKTAERTLGVYNKTLGFD